MADRVVPGVFLLSAALVLSACGRDDAPVPYEVRDFKPFLPENCISYSDHIRIAGSVPTDGPAWGIHIEGDRIYIAQADAGLAIFDISSPRQPVALGSVDGFGYAKYLTVAGSYAYVTTLRGMTVVDVSDPRSPRKRGTYLTRTRPARITMYGTHVLLADDDEGLHVVDVSDPDEPKRLTSLVYWRSLNPMGLAVSSHYLFIADDNYGLCVVDLEDPANPVLVGLLALYSAENIAIGENPSYAYISHQVMDISNPKKPVLVRQREQPGPDLAPAAVWDGEGVDLMGSILFHAANTDVRVYDVSNPGTFQLIGILDTPDVASTVATREGFAYVASGHAGLQVVELGNGQMPAALGLLELAGPDEVGAISLSETNAFVARGQSGLDIVDVTRPEFPMVVGNIDYGGVAIDVRVAGTHCYIADDEGLTIMDVADPAHPVLKGRVATPNGARSVVLTGNHAIVNDMSRQMHVIDVTDVENPSLRGSVTLGGDGWALDVSGTLAYAGGDFGLKIVDVSDPWSPRIHASLAVGYVEDVVVRGIYAYLGGRLYAGSSEPFGFGVVQVSNPGAPVLISRPSTDARPAYDIELIGSRAYLACHSSYQVVDIGNPLAPLLVGENQAVACRQFAVVGEVLYSGRWNSISIMPLDCVP